MARNKLKGYLCVILSAFLFGAVPFLTVSLDAVGVSNTVLILLRALLMIPTFVILSLVTGVRRFRLPGRELVSIALHALLGAVLTPLWLFTSYLLVDTGIGTSVHFTYPLFVLLGGALFFRARLTRSAVICTVLCVGGIALFMNGGTVSFPGILSALLSGVAYAAYALLLEHSHILDRRNIYHYSLWFYMFTSLFMVIVTAVTGGADFAFSPKTWLLIVVTALLSCGAAAVLFQVGVKEIGSAKTSLLSTLEPITSIVLGIALLGEPVSLRKLLGCVLILAAVVLVIRQDVSEDG